MPSLRLAYAQAIKLTPDPPSLRLAYAQAIKLTPDLLAYARL